MPREFFLYPLRRPFRRDERPYPKDVASCGSLADVRKILDACFPSTEWGGCMGRLADGADITIHVDETKTGPDGQSLVIAVMVGGSARGDGTIHARKLARATGWAAWDTATSQFLDGTHDTPAHPTPTPAP